MIDSILCQFRDEYYPDTEMWKKIKSSANYIKHTKRFIKVNASLQNKRNIGKFIGFSNFINPLLNDNERPKDWGFHEEILWIFDPLYFLPKEYQFLLTYEKAEWSMENDSCKSPDFVFKRNGEKIGLEVTIANGPISIPLSLHFIEGNKEWSEKDWFNFIRVIKSVGKTMERKYDLLNDNTIVNTILKKINNAREKWSVSDCQKKYLVIIIIKHKIGELWFVKKMALQKQVDLWNKEFGDGVFDRIIIS